MEMEREMSLPLREGIRASEELRPDEVSHQCDEADQDAQSRGSHGHHHRLPPMLWQQKKRQRRREWA
jgi:hypothetical protein